MEPGRESLRRRIARRWSALTATQRRRIVLGSMAGLALAAFDLLLLVVAGALFALSELAPSPHHAARAG